MEVKAPAKINLFLNVGNKREDSYHDLISIMQKVSLFDIIKINPAQEFSFKAPSWIPEKENLAYLAAEKFFQTAPVEKKCAIELEKNIPAGAGLGGGSSDAAAVLKGLNRFFNTGLSRDKLESLGEDLGSDVNFFLYEGGSLVEGRGEKITPLETGKKINYRVLLVDPGINISTRKVYNEYPGGRLTEGKEVNNIISKYRDLEWPLLLRNDLEETVFRMYPVLKDLKNRLENWGTFPLLSGSGSCMFAISEDVKLLESVCSVVRNSFKFNTYLLNTI